MKSYTEITLDEFKQLINEYQKQKNWQEDAGGTIYGRTFFSDAQPSPWDVNIIFFDARKDELKERLFTAFPIRNCRSIAHVNNLNEFIKKSIELGFDPQEYLSFRTNGE